MWDLLGPGIEPTSSALVSGFFTIEPPGKPLMKVYTESKLFYLLEGLLCLNGISVKKSLEVYFISLFMTTILS